MASTFDTKFNAILDKIPHSVMETPWKRTLFWIMYGVVAITALLLVVIFGLLKAVFDPDKSASRPYSNEEYASTQAEFDVHGYRRGDPYYSKPGTTNPLLLELWEADNNKNHF